MPKKKTAAPPDWKAFASRRRDPATKREAVLKTAAQLFLENGYGRTSMNDVADRLSITKPALYHYFRNKEDILIECYRLGTGLIEEILNEIAEHCGTGLEKVEAFIYSYANVMTLNFGRCVMRLDDAELSTGALSEVRSYKRKIDRRLRSFIQEGIDDGSITPCDVKIAAFSIAGALNWICHWYEPDGPLSAEEIATQFTRTLTRGLAQTEPRHPARPIRPAPRDTLSGPHTLSAPATTDPRRGPRSAPQPSIRTAVPLHTPQRPIRGVPQPRATILDQPAPPDPRRGPARTATVKERSPRNTMPSHERE
jgi:AcrR family transcriptional regulator